jgi:hypothetical protein
MSAEIEKQFYDANDATFAISNETENGINMVKALPSSGYPNNINYCSGKNMHFDIQRNNDGPLLPYWTEIGTSDPSNVIVLPSTGKPNVAPADISNTMLRYMVVPGNIFGNFNVWDETTPPPADKIPKPGCGGSSTGGVCGAINPDWSKTLCNNPKCGSDSDCKDQTMPKCYNIPCP